MRFMINHQTQYQYEDLVKNSTQYIRLTPKNTSRQQVMYWAVSVPGEKIEQSDGFGNHWIASSQRYDYQQLMIMAQGTVEIDINAPYTLDDSVPAEIYLQTTKATQCSPEMMQFAHMYVRDKTYAELVDLAKAVLEYMPYYAGETQVETTAAEAFEHKRGVCQDHAQVFASMARYLGFAARYVSGYLYVDRGNHLASHAWTELYIDGKWYCFDISNQLFTPNAHIQLAVGRDYADVAPIRGVRYLGTKEIMQTVVQVLAC